MTRLFHPRPALLAFTLAALAAVPAYAQQPPRVIQIGTSGTLAAGAPGPKENAALATLQDFIKDETGMADEIVRQKDWQELAQKMTRGQLQLGMFQGYEFAWAQEKYPGLKPLALAVNVYTYPTVYVVTRKDDAAADFAGLRGKSLGLPTGGAGYLRLYVDRQSEAQGKKADAFFSHITPYDNVEDALDDCVDGKVQAVVADRAALESYKQQKSGRFAQLRPVAHSAALPPAVLAYYDDALDSGTLQRFRDSLTRASRTDRGQTLLTLFKLTGFVPPPADLDKVLAQTRKDYPAPGR